MLWNGLAQSSRTVYMTAVRAYDKLCRFRLLNPWPATEESLIEYACARAQGCNLLDLRPLAPSTISRHMSALRSYHVDRGISCAVFESDRLRRILQGITSCFNEPKARLRHPLTKDVLRAMLRVRVEYPSKHAQLDDLNFRSALKVAYAGFLRLGEITYNPGDTVNPTIFQRYHVLRRDVRVNRDHVTLHLRNSKADRDKQGVYICMARTGDIICPVTALEQLFLVDSRPPDAPLFRFINRGFRRQNVINRIKSLLALAGVDPGGYTGHSLRRGAAQDAHDMGLPRDDIMMLGRWSSDAVDRYYNTNRARVLQLSRQVLTGRLTPEPGAAGRGILGGSINAAFTIA
jgi:integrase